MQSPHICRVIKGKQSYRSQNWCKGVEDFTESRMKHQKHMVAIKRDHQCTLKFFSLCKMLPPGISFVSLDMLRSPRRHCYSEFFFVCHAPTRHALAPPLRLIGPMLHKAKMIGSITHHSKSKPSDFRVCETHELISIVQKAVTGHKVDVWMVTVDESDKKL